MSPVIIPGPYCILGDKSPSPSPVQAWCKWSGLSCPCGTLLHRSPLWVHSHCEAFSAAFKMLLLALLHCSMHSYVISESTAMTELQNPDTWPWYLEVPVPWSGKKPSWGVRLMVVDAFSPDLSRCTQMHFWGHSGPCFTGSLHLLYLPMTLWPGHDATDIVPQSLPKPLGSRLLIILKLYFNYRGTCYRGTC